MSVATLIPASELDDRAEGTVALYPVDSSDGLPPILEIQPWLIAVAVTGSLVCLPILGLVLISDLKLLEWQANGAIGEVPATLRAEFEGRDIFVFTRG